MTEAYTSEQSSPHPPPRALAPSPRELGAYMSKDQDLSHIYNDRRLFGHPVGLAVLFFTEMWERFSYYGMRGLLKLYMVNYLFVASRQVLQGGEERVAGDPSAVWGWEFIRTLIDSDPNTPIGAYASVLYGWYTGLVYATPIIGGFLADRYSGLRARVESHTRLLPRTL